MAERDLRKWTNFFNDSGVPRGPAAEYATLFCDHRIKDDLLGDLTKDILNDIGITVIGDIMCILKHARAVYAKLEREKSSNQLVDASNPKNEPTTKQDVEVSSTRPVVKKKKPVQKIVSKPNAPELPQTESTSDTSKKMLVVGNSKITITTDNPIVIPKKRPVKDAMTLSERFASEKTVPPKVTRKSLDLTDTLPNSMAKKPVVKTGQQVAAQEKTRTSPPKRKSAFERLGKEATTSQNETEMLRSKIKITKLTKSPITASTSESTSVTKGESSVFKRLGEAKAEPVSTTRMATTIRTVTGLGPRLVSSGGEKNDSKSHSVLRPLKPTRAVKPVKPVSPVHTATKILSTSSDSSPETHKTKRSVFSRLGSPR